MAKNTKVEELRAKVSARKAAKKTKTDNKYSKMQILARKSPERLDNVLISLGDKFASMAEGVENLRENLGLSLGGKTASKKTYGEQFRVIAAESPERLEDALIEAYDGLNAIAEDIEAAASELGVQLHREDEVVEEVAHDIIDEAEDEGESLEHELEEKAEGDDDDMNLEANLREDNREEMPELDSIEVVECPECGEKAEVDESDPTHYGCLSCGYDWFADPENDTYSY